MMNVKLNNMKSIFMMVLILALIMNNVFVSSSDEDSNETITNEEGNTNVGRATKVKAEGNTAAKVMKKVAARSEEKEGSGLTTGSGGVAKVAAELGAGPQVRDKNDTHTDEKNETKNVWKDFPEVGSNEMEIFMNFLTDDMQTQLRHQSELRTLEMKIGMQENIMHDLENKIETLTRTLNMEYYAESKPQYEPPPPIRTNFVKAVVYNPDNKLQNLQIIQNHVSAIKDQVAADEKVRSYIEGTPSYGIYKYLVSNINATTPERPSDDLLNYVNEALNSMDSRMQTSMEYLTDVVRLLMSHDEFENVTQEEWNRLTERHYKIIDYLGERLTLLVNEIQWNALPFDEALSALRKKLLTFKQMNRAMKGSLPADLVRSFNYRLFDVILKTKEDVLTEDRQMYDEVAEFLVKEFDGVGDDKHGIRCQLSMIAAILNDTWNMEAIDKTKLEMSEQLDGDMLDTLKDSMYMLLYQINKRWNHEVTPIDEKDLQHHIGFIKSILYKDPVYRNNYERTIFQKIEDEYHSLKKLHGQKMPRQDCSMCEIDDSLSYLTYLYLEDRLVTKYNSVIKEVHYSSLAEDTVIEHLVNELRIGVDFHKQYIYLLEGIKHLRTRLFKYSKLLKTLTDSSIRWMQKSPNILIADILSNGNFTLVFTQSPAFEVIRYIRLNLFAVYKGSHDVLLGSDICDRINEIKRKVWSIDEIKDVNDMRTVNVEMLHLLLSCVNEAIIEIQRRGDRLNYGEDCEDDYLSDCQSLNTEFRLYMPYTVNLLIDLLNQTYVASDHNRYEKLAYSTVSAYFQYLDAKEVLSDIEHSAYEVLEELLTVPLRPSLYDKYTHYYALKYVVGVLNIDLEETEPRLQDSISQDEIEDISDRVDLENKNKIRLRRERKDYLRLAEGIRYEILKNSGGSQLQKLAQLDFSAVQYLYTRLIDVEDHCYIKAHQKNYFKAVFLTYDYEIGKKPLHQRNYDPYVDHLFILHMHLKNKKENIVLCIPRTELLYSWENELFSYLLRKYLKVQLSSQLVPEGFDEFIKHEIYTDYYKIYPKLSYDMEEHMEGVDRQSIAGEIVSGEGGDEQKDEVQDEVHKEEEEDEEYDREDEDEEYDREDEEETEEKAIPEYCEQWYGWLWCRMKALVDQE